MKKSFVALLAAFVLGGGVFAENYTKGIDIQFGIPLGFTTMEKDIVGYDLKAKMFEGGFQLKLATYDCFLLNDMLGIYASVGANTGIILTGSEHSWDDVFIGISGEFMIGPAFGVNLGKTRFQTGLAFHAVVARGIGLDDYDIKYHSLGFALTPQFRFTANRRCSFILGCDFTFDFPNKITYIVDDIYHYDDDDDYHYDTEMKFDSGFRFGVTPYIGLGINF